MKKTLIILGLLSILTTTTFASNFFSISYGQGLEDIILTDNENEVLFKNYQSVRLRSGVQYFPIEDLENHPFGMYLDIGYGFTDKVTYIDNGNEEAFRSMSLILNLGFTFTLNNYFVLFGGPGFESRAISSKDDALSKSFEETNLNLNGGLIMYFYENRMGLIMEYDSAPNAVSVGIAWRYGKD